MNQDNPVEIESSGVIIKMFLDKNPQLLPLLMHIKQNENDEKGISRQNVVKYMQKEDLSSRITTLNMINALLQEKILIDQKTKNYQSNLKINPQFDFFRLLIDAIYYKMTGIEKVLKPFETVFEGINTKVESKMDKGKYEFKITLSAKPDSLKLVPQHIQKKVTH